MYTLNTSVQCDKMHFLVKDTQEQHTFPMNTVPTVPAMYIEMSV